MRGVIHASADVDIKAQTLEQEKSINATKLNTDNWKLCDDQEMILYILIYNHIFFVINERI